MKNDSYVSWLLPDWGAALGTGAPRRARISRESAVRGSTVGTQQVIEASSCVDRLRVLADPTRLAVIETLMRGPKRVGQLIETLGVEQSLLSHHLKILRDAGLVQSTREGKSVRYELADDVQGSASGNAINLGCCRLSFEGDAT